VSVEAIGHTLAFGLGVPIAFAVIGSIFGGFPAAMLGFAIGIATCVVAAEIRTVLINR